MQALIDLKKKDKLSPFPNVKRLELKNCFGEEEDIMLDLVDILPEMDVLEKSEGDLLRKEGRAFW